MPPQRLALSRLWLVPDAPGRPHAVALNHDRAHVEWLHSARWLTQLPGTPFAGKVRQKAFQPIATSSVLEQYLRDGFGDREAIEPVGGIELGEVASLAEAIDAKRCHALTEHTT